MGESSLPRINEAAAFLAKYAPGVQQKLRGLGPEMASLVEPGLWGGDEDIPDDQSVRVGLIARAKVLDAALGEAITQSEKDLAQIADRLRKLKRVRFLALLVGTISSSGVILTAFTAPVAAAISGSLALLASILGISADNLILGPKVSEEQLRSTAAIFAKAIGEGGLTRRMLASFAAIDFRSDELKRLIEDANRLFGELMAARSQQLGAI